MRAEAVERVLAVTFAAVSGPERPDRSWTVGREDDLAEHFQDGVHDGLKSLEVEDHFFGNATELLFGPVARLAKIQSGAPGLDGKFHDGVKEIVVGGAAVAPVIVHPYENERHDRF